MSGIVENKLRIVITTALIDDVDRLGISKRIQHYIEQLDNLKELNLLEYCYVIETVSTDTSLFEKYIPKERIHCSNVNNLTYKNRGSNEVVAMLTSLPTFKFNDDDMIIKLTGRYLLVDNYFIDKVKYSESDILYRKADDTQVFTFLYAMRYKILYDTLQQCDIVEMENTMINIEKLLSLKTINSNIEYVSKLNVIAKFSTDDVNVDNYHLYTF